MVGVTIQGADTGDTTTMVETVIAAAEQVQAVLPTESAVAEVVADKGYHSNETMVDLAAVGVLHLPGRHEPEMSLEAAVSEARRGLV